MDIKSLEKEFRKKVCNEIELFPVCLFKECKFFFPVNKSNIMLHNIMLYCIIYKCIPINLPYRLLTFYQQFQFMS